MMIEHEPSLASLERLATSSELADRAFAASVLQLRPRHQDGERAATLYRVVRDTAARQHAALRARIRERTLEPAEFLAQLQAVPFEWRDHLCEEIFDLAYSPLEPAPVAEAVTHHYPSGVGEILFMLERSQLRPDRVFVDLGAGLGKVVLLVALLSGARAVGVELDPARVERARAAARALQLDNAEFIAADLREVSLPEADVYYMFMPGVALRSSEIIARLAPLSARRHIRLFAEKLDTTALPWLRPCNEGSYWLEMYESV